jgi:hypothetical protein
MINTTTTTNTTNTTTITTTTHLVLLMNIGHARANDHRRFAVSAEVITRAFTSASAGLCKRRFHIIC